MNVMPVRTAQPATRAACKLGAAFVSLAAAISLVVGTCAAAAAATSTVPLQVRVVEEVLSPTCSTTTGSTKVTDRAVAAGAHVCFVVQISVRGAGAVSAGDALAGVTVLDDFPFAVTSVGVVSAASGGPTSCTHTALAGGQVQVSCSISPIPQGKATDIALSGVVPASAAPGTRYTNVVTLHGAAVSSQSVKGRLNAKAWVTVESTSA